MKETKMSNYQIDYPQMQDVSGLTPVFQNIGAQQALHNQLMQQQSQEMQDAANIGASYGKSISGLNPLAMAAMLRSGGGDLTIPTSTTSQVGGLNPSMTASNPVGSLAYSPTTYGGSSYGFGGFK
jgi:hypothetical protein